MVLSVYGRSTIVDVYRRNSIVGFYPDVVPGRRFGINDSRFFTWCPRGGSGATFIKLRAYGENCIVVVFQSSDFKPIHYFKRQFRVFLAGGVVYVPAFLIQ